MDFADFGELFQDEHRSLLCKTEALADRLREEVNPDIEDEINELSELLGPHFRYEEEALYPSLKDQYGRIYVKRLYDSHEGTIHTIRKLRTMNEASTLNNQEALDLVYGWLLPHVSDCEGLSIMVDQIPEDALDTIVEARENAMDEGLDLLTWADKKREGPDFGTLSIFD